MQHSLTSLTLLAGFLAPLLALRDCLVFADLSVQSRATDVLVKTRYRQIWAFDRERKQLRTVKNES